MEKLAIGKRLLKATIALGAALVSAAPAFAQGCALCYADAAAAGPQAQSALRHGILVLLFPPMFIFAGMYLLLYRRRNVHRETSEDVPTAVCPSLDSTSEVILHLN